MPQLEILLLDRGLGAPILRLMSARNWLLRELVWAACSALAVIVIVVVRMLFADRLTSGQLYVASMAAAAVIVGPTFVWLYRVLVRTRPHRYGRDVE